MTRLAAIRVRNVDSDIDDYSEPVTPCDSVLWAMLDRALRDLELAGELQLADLSDAIAWFHGKRKDERISFAFVTKQCALSKRFLALTAKRVAAAEKRLECFRRLYAKQKAVPKKASEPVRAELPSCIRRRRSWR